ncbi:malate dehydrogenase [Exiguobacterium acetylicum]|uniref:malate dehydrogenase n=1 Tax=Exiguobacterium sp. BMC-KP TaxID=1684312 RepID=UPI0006AA2566|nr:malate dehydrogenase [Exiguobacterium sp. BMC-KP]KOP29955.1 malate dehydrogenase [Exiguobacterium sp. BMC-KP]
MNRRKKIAVIGSGFTGATTALYLAQQELGDIVLVDRPEQEDPTKGKALDMQEAAPILGFDASVTGTSDYADIKGADIVVITAGIARKPGMSREDLVSTNAAVMTAVTKEIVTYAPGSIIIVLTNPVDAMTYAVYQASGFPKERVIGQSGVLDTARFRTFLAEELNVSVKDVSGFVLGGHGDDMVPLLRYSQAGGIPIEKLVSKERLDAIVNRTRKGGGEIVQLLGNGSAYYAPAAAIAEMVEAILKDQRRILPAIAYLEGEYGYNDMYFGVPVILGGNGVEHVYELELTTDEQEALNRSASTVRSVLDLLKS